MVYRSSIRILWIHVYNKTGVPTSICCQIKIVIPRVSTQRLEAGFPTSSVRLHLQGPDHGSHQSHIMQTNGLPQMPLSNQRL